MKILNCKTCDTILTGRKKSFCSIKCRNTNSNRRNQNYELQQARGRARKKKLIISKGGKCARCEYSKNISALTFHHISPQDKNFQLDMRSLSNRTWDKCLEEANKCLLLCANCHLEEHNPDGHDWK